MTKGSVGDGGRPLAFVVPRYAPRAAGGAEVLVQSLAEHLAARGHRVEVLTTCAEDPHTWANVLSPGVEEREGVTVRRFPVDPGRVSASFLSIQERISRGHRVSRRDEEAWIAGSVVSAPLMAHLRASCGGYRAVILAPYLFGTTWFGAAACPEKTILVPCLHDEPFAALSIFADMFDAARGIFFNTRPEMALARRLFGLRDDRLFVVSCGVEAASVPDPARWRRRRRLEGPYLLYAGRREGGKNTRLLVDYFRMYRRRGRDLRLVLAGTGEVPRQPGDEAWLTDLGYVSEEEKIDAMGGALAFCQPSRNESLSIVIMESWLAGRPVLVHGGCPVTRDHVENSGGGLWFEDYFTFEACLDYFAAHPGEATAMGAAGGAYVRREYSWEAVLDRFESALESLGL